MTGVLLAGLFFLLSASPAAGWQTYEALAAQNNRGPILNELYTLPGTENGSVQVFTSFSIPYRTLSFRRTTADSGEVFSSVAKLSIEFFEAEAEDMRRPERVSLGGRNPAGRASWTDTARVVRYEGTQSDTSRLEGDLRVDLPPGNYLYILQVSRGGGAAENSSRPRAIRIRPYEEQEHGDILVGRSEEGRFRLLNIGNRVYFAEDYEALIHLRGHREGDRYRLQVNRVRITEEDTTDRNTVYEQELQQDEILTGIRPSGGGTAALTLREDPPGHAYAVTEIPNRRFPNNAYRIRVTRDGEPVAERVLQSYWPDMPVALLNLDVAIDMLRFIVPSEQIREIKRGSMADRERKFREFWSQRDPTPETEYNELMAEYYRRIDAAYDQFTTSGTPGFETDQGEIYITYGPPQQRERTFPSGEPAMEVWTYPSRTFVFRATSGFGEFELVSR